MAAFDKVSRLAIMIVAKRDLPPQALAQSLSARRQALLAAVDGRAALRAGVRCRPDPLAATMGERETAAIDGAVEFTAAEDELGFLFDRAPAIAAVLADLVEPGETLLMGGETYRMVEPRSGGVFLSLTFRRDPAITVDEFRNWWLRQHGPLAVSLLSSLLAYDQVHVDHELSRAAAAAAGLSYGEFDAYDNLSWASPEGFLASVSDAETQRKLFEDEQGHIDNSTNRAALMTVLPA